MENVFFSRDLFDDVMSVHKNNMKHAHAIEFEFGFGEIVFTSRHKQAWRFATKS